MNNLTGMIPVDWITTSCFCSNLSENNLQGEIPPELGQLRNLQFLGLANNQITSVIQESIGSLSNLSQIDLLGNRLTRSVLMSFSTLLNLRCIFVDGSHLSGNLDFLSASLSKCRSLTTIDIPNNAFTGRLPTSIANQFPSVNSAWWYISICPEIYSKDEYQVHLAMYLILRSWIYPPMHFSLPSQNP